MRSSAVELDGFRQFRVTIDFETDREAIAFYAALNHPVIMSNLGDIFGEKVLDGIRKVRDQIDAHIPIMANLKYKSQPQKLISEE